MVEYKEIRSYNIILPILILSLAILASCAGMEKAPESELTIQKVFEVPSFSEDQIYNQIKIWVAQNFQSAKAVIEHDDKQGGTLIGNGIIKYPCKGLGCVAKGDWKVHFTMRVDVKNEKFRLTFMNLFLSWPSSYNRTFGYQKGKEVPVWQQGDVNAIRPELLKFGDQIAISLKSSKQKDNW